MIKANTKKILILVNRYTTLFNFRFELVERLLKKGYKITVSMPYSEEAEIFPKLGIEYENIKIDRHGVNPLKELDLIKEYRRLIKKYNPSIILSYTVKPNIYGAIAANKYKKPIICNITGLGTALQNKGIKKIVLTNMYKFAFRNVNTIFFQNKGNLKFFTENKLIKCDYKLIPGSGVNLKKFQFIEYPKNDKVIKLLTVGKLMKDKGTDILLDAINNVKNKYPKVEFTLIGRFEEDYKDKVSAAVNKGLIKYKKENKNLIPLYKNCHALIHPTFHEGMSNVMQEAAACGRPLLASNIHGCKEIFDEGISGIAFEPKDINSLTNAIIKFVELEYKKKKEMGLKAHEKVTNEFDRNIVVNAYMQEIERLLSNV